MEREYHREEMIVDIEDGLDGLNQQKMGAHSMDADSQFSSKKEIFNTELVKDLLRVPSIPIITEFSTSNSCTIHRVPPSLCLQNTNVYLPQIIAIGPLHYHRRVQEREDPQKLYNHPPLKEENDHQRPLEEHKWRYMQAMEGHKQRYLHAILTRSRRGEESKEDCLHRFLVAVKKLEVIARECYSEELEMDSDHFVAMMLLDGCFIIELFHRIMVEDNQKNEDDPLIILEWLRKQLAIDLLKLENQIPFFLLEYLSHLMNISRTHLVEMTLKFFKFAVPDKIEIRVPNHDIHHLLHLVHSILLSNLEREKNPKADTINPICMIPCASDLKKTGFKFKKKNEKSGLLDIEFIPRRYWVLPQSGEIKIPQVMVSVVTAVLLLNLAAFEQCYRHCGTSFSAYLVFMDCLIASDEDVGILCHHGIENCIGSNKHLVDLINQIGGKLVVDDKGILDTMKRINKRYKEATNHRIRASIKRNYASNRMAVWSILLAFLSFSISIGFQVFSIVRSYTK